MWANRAAESSRAIGFTDFLVILGGGIFALLFLCEWLFALRQSTRALLGRLVVNIVIFALTFAVAISLLQPAAHWALRWSGPAHCSYHCANSATIGACRTTLVSIATAFRTAGDFAHYSASSAAVPRVLDAWPLGSYRHRGMKMFLKHARQRVCVLRSIKVALVVGTILAGVNHYDAILSGTFSTRTVVQIAVTYLVPFCVSTFASAMQARHIDLNSRVE